MTMIPLTRFFHFPGYFFINLFEGFIEFREDFSGCGRRCLLLVEMKNLPLLILYCPVTSSYLAFSKKLQNFVMVTRLRASPRHGGSGSF